MRYFWIAAGFCALGAGIVGIFLPLWPTVPFLLLAAFCFARGSERLHDWLMTHPRFSQPILDWEERGAIGRKAKIIATASMGAAFALSLVFGVAPKILAIQALVLCAVGVFIWTRPDT